jgi:thiamine-monophosphate kinase
MMDSSDGLARSLHQLAAASAVGFDIDREAVPIHDAVADYAAGGEDRWAMATTVGEDFELVCTLPAGAVSVADDAVDVEVSVIGEVTDTGVRVDGEPLADDGYSHG